MHILYKIGIGSLTKLVGACTGESRSYSFNQPWNLE